MRYYASWISACLDRTMEEIMLPPFATLWVMNADGSDQVAVSDDGEASDYDPDW